MVGAVVIFHLIIKEIDMEVACITVVHRNGKYVVVKGIPSQRQEHVDNIECIDNGKEYDKEADAWEIAKSISLQTGIPLCDPREGVKTPFRH